MEPGPSSAGPSEKQWSTTSKALARPPTPRGPRPASPRAGAYPPEAFLRRGCRGLRDGPMGMSGVVEYPWMLFRSARVHLSCDAAVEPGEKGLSVSTPGPHPYIRRYRLRTYHPYPTPFLGRASDRQ